MSGIWGKLERTKFLPFRLSIPNKLRFGTNQHAFKSKSLMQKSVYETTKRTCDFVKSERKKSPIAFSLLDTG